MRRICLAASTVAFAFLAVTWMAPAVALAQGCGMVTFEGECQGNVVVYCNPDTMMVEMIDCEANLGMTAVCMEIDPSYGVDCALAVDEGCVDDEGNIYFCQGMNPGCFENLEGAVCAEGIGPCTMDDVDTCNGNDWIYECSVNQPYIVDCAAYGGTCGTRPGGCYDIPIGSYCGDGFTCADGLVCGQLGLCEAGMRDGGVAPRDGGVMAPRDGGSVQMPAPMTKTDSGGCGCSTTSASGAAGWVFLSGLVLVIFRSRASRRARASRESSR